MNLLPPAAAWSAVPGLRKAAVLVPMRESDGGVELLLLRRTQQQGDRHSGQVAFPGGGRAGSETPVETALRETWEEVGIPAERVEVLGSLPVQKVITGFAIHPVVGQVPMDSEFSLQASEVARAFWVPLGDLLDPEAREVGTVPSQWGGIPGMRFPHYRVEGEVLWGATERIVASLLERCHD